MLVNPQHPHACETGGVIRCGLQTRLDVGPHGIPRGSSLAGQPRDSGSLEAQLTNRPADRPGPQTRPGCAHPLVMFQECHRLAGVFAAYPASYCAIGYAPGPRPKARRSPPPPHARDLEQSPTTRAASTAITGLYVEHQSIWGANHAHRPPNRRADHTDYNDQATHSSR